MNSRANQSLRFSRQTDRGWIPLPLKLLPTLVPTLLALKLWVGANDSIANGFGDDGKSSFSRSNGASGEQSGWRRDHDDDQAKRQRRGDQSDSGDCDEGRPDHGKPKPPRPPEDRTGVPSAPSSLAAEAVSLFQINLSWTDNSTNELGFKIERSLDGTNFVQIAQVLAATTVYRDLNRFPDTKYFYRVRAFDAKGNSAYSAVARTQTPAPECELSVSIQSPSYYVSGMNLGGAVAIAPGAFHNLILKRDGTVSLLEYGVLTNVGNLSNIVAIAAGAAHSMALRANGTVATWAQKSSLSINGNGVVTGWGENTKGQATPPSQLTNVTAIAAGGTHSLALKNDGTVIAWGDNEWWQARPPTNLTGVVAIAAGDRHSLALRSDGTVVGWGFNDQHAAQPPPGLRDVIAIAAGQSHSLALKSDGTVVSWGISEEGLVPSGLTNVIAIAAGQTQSLALKQDGTFVYWGSGQYSQLIPQLDLGGVVALASAYADHMFLTTHPAPPDLPYALLMASNRVELSWLDYSGGTASFEVKRSMGDFSAAPPGSFPGQPGYFPTNWDSLGQVATGITQFTDATVVAGKSYLYQIEARNGCGAAAGSVPAAITIAPPSKPPQIFSTYVQANDVTFYWFGDLVGATRARIDRAMDADGQPGVWNEIAAALQSPGFSGYYTDVGLPPNSTNWYRVRIENGLGTSPYSEPVVAVITPPSAPSFLEARVGNTNQVLLTWYPNTASGQEHYQVDRAPDENGVIGSWSEIASDVAPTNYPPSFTDPNVRVGQTYWYRVRTSNGAGVSDYSQPAGVALWPPGVPGLYTQTISNAVLLTVWPHVESERFATPQFERAVANPNGTEIWRAITPAAIADSVSFIDRALKNDVLYRYRVKLVSWLGESPYSEPVSVMVSPPPPPAIYPWFPRATIGRSNYVKLLWQSGRRPVEEIGYHLERALVTNYTPGQWLRIATVGLTNSQYSSYEDSLSQHHAGRTYQYRISSFNMVGESSFIESYPVKLEPPSAPALGATPFKNQVMLNWSVNFAGVMGFRLERAPDAAGLPGAWTQITTFSPTEISTGNYMDVLPATPARYWYRVQAYNWVGDSEFCAPVAVRIQPPQTPAFLQAKIGRTNQITLVWTHSGSDATTFQIERAQSSNGALGAWEEVISLTAMEAWIPDAFVGVDSNAQAHADYVYRIRATNLVGSSPYSEPFAVSVLPPPPLTLIQLSIYGGRVQLGWNSIHSYYDYGEINGFEIERALNDPGASDAWIPIAQVADYAFLDNHPPPNSTCRYRVRAVNWVGPSDYLESASVAIVPPEPPRQLVANIGGSNQVELSWFAPAANDQDGFLLELAEDVSGQPGAWQLLASIAATNLWGANFTQTNARAFATNWYRVRAFNPAGLSAAPPPVQFIVSPPPAPVLAAPSQFADRVNLAWNVYTAGEVGGFKVERAVDLSGNPGAWTEIARVSATNSFSGWWYAAYGDAGRSVDTTYWYRVRSSNWVGDGEPSVALAHTVKGPTAPYLINARIGTTNEVRVSWFPGFDDVAAYELERAFDVGGSPGDWRLLATVPNTGLALSFTDTNLTRYATNWYRVRAFNVLGGSAFTPALAVGVLPPSPPVVYAANVFADQVHLKWYSGAANYGAIAGSKVERATDTGTGLLEWSEIENVPAENIWWDTYHETIDSNRNAHATYWYRLRSYNWLGDGEYSPATKLTIVPPGAPENLVIASSGPELRLSWVAAHPQDQDGFKLERRTDLQSDWTEIAVIPAPNIYFVEYLDQTPIANLTNYYRVRAFNVVGDSPYRAAEVFLPLPSAAAVALPPQILSIALTNQSVLVTWQALAGTTNIVEAAPALSGNFAPLTANWRIEGAGVVTTNFLDAGVGTNLPARFYRIRSLP